MQQVPRLALWPSMSKHGVYQLAKLTLNYCAHSGSSRGVRCVTRPLEESQPRCREKDTRALLLITALRHSSPSSFSAFVAEHVEPLRAQYPHLPLETAVRPGKHPHALAEYGALRRPNPLRVLSLKR